MNSKKQITKETAWMIISIICILAAGLCFWTITEDIDNIEWHLAHQKLITYEEYEGDAYTGIQNATVRTAFGVSGNTSAILYLLKAIRLISSISFLVAGMICGMKALFSEGLKEEIPSKSNENKNDKNNTQNIDREIKNIDNAINTTDGNSKYHCQGFAWISSEGSYGTCETCNAKSKLHSINIMKDREAKSLNVCETCKNLYIKNCKK